jgi:hypothetical protein
MKAEKSRKNSLMKRKQKNFAWKQKKSRNFFCFFSAFMQNFSAFVSIGNFFCFYSALQAEKKQKKFLLFSAFMQNFSAFSSPMKMASAFFLQIAEIWEP